MYNAHQTPSAKRYGGLSSQRVNKVSASPSLSYKHADHRLQISSTLKSARKAAASSTTTTSSRHRLSDDDDDDEPEDDDESEGELEGGMRLDDDDDEGEGEGEGERYEEEEEEERRRRRRRHGHGHEHVQRRGEAGGTKDLFDSARGRQGTAALSYSNLRAGTSTATAARRPGSVARSSIAPPSVTARSTDDDDERGAQTPISRYADDDDDVDEYDDEGLMYDDEDNQLETDTPRAPRPRRQQHPHEQHQRRRRETAASSITSAEASLAGVPLAIQEALVVRDLLDALVGVPGQHYVRFSADSAPDDPYERARGKCRFAVDEQGRHGVHESVRQLASRVLPLADAFVAVRAFLEHAAARALEAGATTHALCASVRELTRDYLVLVAHVERAYLTDPAFSLQKLWLLVHPSIHSIRLVMALTVELVALDNGLDPDASTSDDDTDDDDADKASSSSSSSEDERFGGAGLKAVLNEIKTSSKGAGDQGATATWARGPAKGGEVLDVLARRLARSAGDPVAVRVYTHLLHGAAGPYARTLLRWTRTGALDDPHDEFIVREASSISKARLDVDYTDEYWDRRYTLRDAPRSAAISSDTIGGSSSSSSTAQASTTPAPPVSVDDQPRRRGLTGGAVCPSFLEPSKHKILLAGKYLNVMRECGASPDAAAATEQEEDERDDGMAIESAAFLRTIDTAYAHANKSLLRLLLEGEKLGERLASLKSLFFIDHGDAFTHFLDLAQHELGKKARHVSVSKLQSLLELALRNPSSASSAVTYKEDVKVTVAGSSLTEWLLQIVNVSGALDGTSAAAAPPRSEDNKNPLLGIDALTLDYAVPFPLSLVVSRKTILRYQLVFRHLLRLKHLEHSLGATWLEHAKSPAWRARASRAAIAHEGDARLRAFDELERWRARVFALRARMLAFVQQMHAFVVLDVLEPNWRRLMRRLERRPIGTQQGVETVDALLRLHVDFLDTCLKECMLTNGKLLKAQDKLMTTCALFVSYTAHLGKLADAAAADSQGGDFSMAKHHDFLSKCVSHCCRWHTHSKLMCHCAPGLSRTLTITSGSRSRLSASSPRARTRPCSRSSCAWATCVLRLALVHSLAVHSLIELVTWLSPRRPTIMAPTAARLSSLSTSTLSSILELTRLSQLSPDSAPPPSLLQGVTRALAQLDDGLAQVARERSEPAHILAELRAQRDRLWTLVDDLDFGIARPPSPAAEQDEDEGVDPLSRRGELGVRQTRTGQLVDTDSSASYVRPSRCSTSAH